MKNSLFLDDLEKIQNRATIHIDKSKPIPDSFEEFNQFIGLPRHPATFHKQDLAPYQTQFWEKILNTKYHKFHVNKSRQIGFTEIILRILAFQSFHKYKGGKIMIIAGTREKTTKKIMNRFKELYKVIPHTIEKSDDLTIHLKNGTVIEGLPANSESIRGDTKIKAIFIDEAAHFNRVDDSVVMDAILPIVRTNKSDLFLISTPKGRRGFFYEIDESENDFMKFKYDIWVGVPWIYSKEDAELMLNDPSVDAEQEYLNQYTTSKYSIFGSDFDTDDFEPEF